MPSVSPGAEPDQIAVRWDRHVRDYEAVFEPFSLALTLPVLTRLASPGRQVVDVAAGAGGAALEMARIGAEVTAIDASHAMVERIAERAAMAGLPVASAVMDAGQLEFADASFDAALSAFGIVLIPDAVAALAEMRRVVRPGGQVAVVTWTEPHRYELAQLLAAAADEIWPSRPRPGLPAQLRFREAAALEALFMAAGLPSPSIERVDAHIEAPSAEWLVANLGFAPGMEAMLAGFGEHRRSVCDAVLARLKTRFGDGPVRLGGVAHAGMATVAAGR